VLRLSELRLPLDHGPDDLEQAVLRCLKIPPARLLRCQLVKRSVDARRRDRIQLIYSVDVALDGEAALLRRRHGDRRIRPTPDTHYKYVAQAPEGSVWDSEQRPVVVGAGPCGYFAALLLAQMGFRPLLLERGQPVKQRTADTFGFWRRTAEFNPESNAQFGEGGAGTFSDGKLYSQVSDPDHYGCKVLEELVACGANREILTQHRPHIGTFKLATVVRGLRAKIEALGGEVRFGSRVDQILLKPCAGPHGSGKSQQVVGLSLSDGTSLRCRQVVFAPGHSARDSFQMLQEAGVALEAKPFAVGFRIEHPQALVDEARWGLNAGHPLLGAAEYKLVHHAENGRCVYSFCMCPGGLVVGATSEKGRVVTNGMSQHSRNERNANAAIVVGISPEEDFPDHPLAGIDLQRELETLAYQLGGENYNAPAQLVGDFLKNRPSTELGFVEPSYKPGITLGDLSKAMPAFAVAAIREAIPQFDKQVKGYAMADAIMTGVETRTLAPVSIKRNAVYQSVNTRGLYPAGEGAGYAGGILSAGIDGIKVAEALALDLLK